ncbi:MAG: CIA30 family protein [Leptolyngbya sp. RL_3_1]|nr:CIA30 family protein [Leptolyngbya sp. RL_3_1]
MRDWLRLLETFCFFGEIPLIGNTRWLQEKLGMDFAHSSPLPLPSPSTRSQHIWQLGMIPTDQAKALALGLNASGLTLSSGASTLLPETVWTNGRSLLWWHPPEAGLDLATVIPIVQATSARRTVPLFQFQRASSELTEAWGAVDDVVMGGVSASSLRLDHDYAQFAGQVSTQNSGGFVSVRTRNFEPPYDLGEWQGLRLQVRGDGQRYKLILRDRPAWDGAAYCGSFDTTKGQWQAIEIPFANLIATFRARTVANAPPLNATQVCAFQLMLSKFEYDGQLNPHFQPGAFALDIRDISVYQPAALPPLIAIASSHQVAQAYDKLLSTSGLTYQVLLAPEGSISAPWIEALLSTINHLSAL